MSATLEMKSKSLQDYPDVLTPEDLMEFLHIGRSTAYKALKNRIIPSIRLGKLYRIPKIKLVEYLSSCSDWGADGFPNERSD